MSPICMSHGTHVNECVTSYMKGCLDTRQAQVSMSRVCISHVTHVNQSCYPSGAKYRVNTQESCQLM